MTCFILSWICAHFLHVSDVLAIQVQKYKEVFVEAMAQVRHPLFNSLAPGRIKFNFRKVIYKLTLLNGGWSISCEIALRWMPQDLTDDKSTLVKVMAWCRQATSHYLSQCWPRSLSPNGVTRPQLVNSLVPGRCRNNVKNIIFKLLMQNSTLGTQCEIALMWMPQNLTNWKSTFVQVMDWCHQATSHYLSQCWPRSMLPYSVTKPQCVNPSFPFLALDKILCIV